jgi:5,10-methylenetetrahydrofolate reductase
MTKVTDAVNNADGRTVFICDFTPPRGGTPELLDGARELDADFISVAYNPGKLVRADSAAVAYAIKQRHGRDVVFNVSPRDMNRLALESRLLGAQLLGLENVLVLQGDALTERDVAKPAGDYTASELIHAISQLNQGVDFKGSNLRAPTDFCIGAALDLNRGIEQEVELTRRKVEASAHFLVAQPIFRVGDAQSFLDAYQRSAGEPLAIPVFWGLQVLRAEGILFSNVPQPVLDALQGGRDGVELALQLYQQFTAAGIRCVYLIAPILRGGARDYEAAAKVLAALR